MKKNIQSKFKMIIVFQIIFTMLVGTMLVQPVFATTEDIKVVESSSFENKTLLSASEGRILFSKDSSYGYLDYDGNVVIPAQFEDAEAFQDGIAKVSTEDGVAYIDLSGKILFTVKGLAAQLNLDEDDFYLYDFSEGFARIDNYDSIGYINTKGELVMPFDQYYDGNDFGDQLALVYDEDYNSYFVKVDGTLAFEPDIDYDYYSFSNGRAVVYDYESGQYGYVNELGKLAVPFILDDAFDYQGDIAIFEEDGKYGIIDKNGKMILKPTFRSVQITDDGYVIGDDGLFIMILTHELKPISKMLSDLNPEIYENLYVESEADAYVFKDFSGNTLASYPAYDYLGDHIFAIDDGKIIDTHAVKSIPETQNAFEINTKYAFKFIDNTGKVVLDLSDYDSVQSFSEGLAVVEKDGKYGYVDKNGNVAIPVQYSFASDFSNGEASVELGDQSYTIDLKGNRMKDAYEDSDSESNSHFYTISEGYYGDMGLANRSTNQIVLQPKYSSIDDMGNDIFLLENDYLYGYYDAQNAKLIEPKFNDLDIDTDANIVIVETEDYQYGMYDLSGKVLLDPVYDSIYSLDDGLYEVVDENQLSGIVDRMGHMIVQPEYDYIDTHLTKDNILIVGMEKGDVSSALIYDLKNKRVLSKALMGYPQQVADKSIVTESVDGTSKIITFAGNTVYETKDTFVEAYGEYYQFVDNQGIYYVVDDQGKAYLKDNAFDDIYLPVESGHMIYTKEGKFGIVSLEGTVKTSKLYNRVSYINDGVMAIFEEGQFGYVDINGKAIVDLGEYDYLYSFQDGLGLVIKVAQ
ncbi:WG repeat-containing protein [Fusibacter ferrireducens]|uniref:WG repeat-containing protein n=1 Tax=Fusibacter ferrireducens TaxID=2785058 RepID=A0ABR9ZY01_9FIRM|nr:WG repeat-containing protein [Fusibacter ferrireducens]MBF4694831.1 WG repeat-containing protein [Fusibacter ferrireducens]